MDILPIQASAVPCERIFSSSKETVSLRRNRIGPQLMEALQLLKFSIAHGRSITFTEGMGEEEEVKVLEEEIMVDFKVPEDIKSFLDVLQCAETDV